MSNFDDTLLDRMKYKTEFSTPRWVLYVIIAGFVAILGYVIYTKCMKPQTTSQE